MCSKRPLAMVFFPRTTNGLPVTTDGQMPYEEHRTSAAPVVLDTTREDRERFMYLKCAEVEKLKNMQLDQMSTKMIMQEEQHKLRSHSLISGYELALQESKNQVTIQKQMYSDSLEKHEQEMNKCKEEISDVNAELEKTKNENINAMEKHEQEMNKCKEEVSDVNAELEKTKNEMEKYERDMNDWKEAQLKELQEKHEQEMNKCKEEVSDVNAELEKTKNENINAMEKYEQDMNDWKEAQLKELQLEHEQELNDWKEAHSQLNKKLSDVKAELEKTKNENIDPMKKHEQELNDWKEAHSQLNKKLSDVKAELEKTKNVNYDAMALNEQNGRFLTHLEKTNSNLFAELNEKNKNINAMERKFDDLASKCDKQEKLLFVIGDLGTAKEERKQQIENEPYPVYFQQEPQACMKGAECQVQMNGWVPMKTVSPTGGIRPPYHRTVVNDAPFMATPPVPGRQGEENASMSVKWSPTFHVNQKGHRDVKEHCLSCSICSLGGNDKPSMHTPRVKTGY